MIPFFCLRENNVTLFKISLGSGAPDGSVKRSAATLTFFFLFFLPRFRPPKVVRPLGDEVVTPSSASSELIDVARFNVGVPGGVLPALLSGRLQIKKKLGMRNLELKPLNLCNVNTKLYKIRNTVLWIAKNESAFVIEAGFIERENKKRVKRKHFAL